MNVLSIIRNSVLAGAVTLLCAAPSWAVPVNITVENGTWDGFSATFIHNNPVAGGSRIYNPLEGTLTGNLVDLGLGVLQLLNITGVLTDTVGEKKGTVTISDGMIIDGPGVDASGFFSYSIAGGPKDGTIGAFTFLDDQGANFLTNDTLQLWGGDVPNSIGMDFRASITTEAVPEPNSLFLLASGLLVGLIWWRYRKAHA